MTYFDMRRVRVFGWIAVSLAILLCGLYLVTQHLLVQHATTAGDVQVSSDLYVRQDPQSRSHTVYAARDGRQLASRITEISLGGRYVVAKGENAWLVHDRACDVEFLATDEEMARIDTMLHAEFVRTSLVPVGWLTAGDPILVGPPAIDCDDQREVLFWSRLKGEVAKG